MEKSALKKLQAFAEKKGFILTEMLEGEKYDQEDKFILEGANDSEDDDFLYFKAEDGLRGFLDAIPDALIEWNEMPPGKLVG
jgi:hypothetical protein